VGCVRVAGTPDLTACAAAISHARGGSSAWEACQDTQLVILLCGCSCILTWLDLMRVTTGAPARTSRKYCNIFKSGASSAFWRAQPPRPRYRVSTSAAGTQPAIPGLSPEIQEQLSQLLEEVDPDEVVVSRAWGHEHCSMRKHAV
jgi:hypothetical protein